MFDFNALLSYFDNPEFVKGFATGVFISALIYFAFYRYSLKELKQDLKDTKKELKETKDELRKCEASLKLKQVFSSQEPIK